MKHNGQDLHRYTGTVTMVRGEADDLHMLQIKVQQLPVSWHEECERLLPPPAPPIVGKEKQADGNWGAKHDYDDPDFKRDRARWEQRCWAKKIVDATVDRNIEFETSDDLLATNPVDYYDGIFGELSEAFSRGEIQRWLLTINSIDQVGGADVALVEEGLFPAIKRLLAVRDVEEDATEG